MTTTRGSPSLALQALWGPCQASSRLTPEIPRPSQHPVCSSPLRTVILRDNSRATGRQYCGSVIKSKLTSPPCPPQAHSSGPQPCFLILESPPGSTLAQCQPQDVLSSWHSSCGTTDLHQPPGQLSPPCRLSSEYTSLGRARQNWHSD